MQDYYKLCREQVAILRNMAKDPVGAFAMPGPLASDSDGMKAMLTTEGELMDDLTKLGLFIDETTHPENIKLLKRFEEDHEGRKSRIFQITKEGRVMFDYCDDPECTVHKKSLPC